MPEKDPVNSKLPGFKKAKKAQKAVKKAQGKTTKLGGGKKKRGKRY